jgi:hypothetical protein
MPHAIERKAFGRSALYIAAALIGIAIAGSVALWAKLGTAVFFESIRTGLAYCFG